MYWLDKEIVVTQINDRFFALNGWDGERYMRCWECGGREGDRFSKVIGIDVYTITPYKENGETKFKIETNVLTGKLDDEKAQMYKNLLPYSGPANTISGEILRAIEFIERSFTRKLNITGAIKFLKSNINDDTCLLLLKEIEDGDFGDFVDLKKRVENIVFGQFLANELELNEQDFEDLNN